MDSLGFSIYKLISFTNRVLLLPLHHFWRISLLDIEFLVDSLFLSALFMSSHCPLANMVSDEKSAINFIEDLLYMKSHFSFDAFKILLSLTFNSLWCVWIQISLSISYLVFVKLLGRVAYYFPSNLGSFRLLLLQIFFCPFLSLSWDSHYAYDDMLDGIP